jgi:hypothetical protein
VPFGRGLELSREVDVQRDVVVAVAVEDLVETVVRVVRIAGVHGVLAPLAVEDAGPGEPLVAVHHEGDVMVAGARRVVRPDLVEELGPSRGEDVEADRRLVGRGERVAHIVVRGAALPRGAERGLLEASREGDRGLDHVGTGGDRDAPHAGRLGCAAGSVEQRRSRLAAGTVVDPERAVPRDGRLAEDPVGEHGRASVDVVHRHIQHHAGVAHPVRPAVERPELRDLRAERETVDVLVVVEGHEVGTGDIGPGRVVHGVERLRVLRTIRAGVPFRVGSGRGRKGTGEEKGGENEENGECSIDDESRGAHQNSPSMWKRPRGAEAKRNRHAAEGALAPGCTSPISVRL